MQHFYIVDSVM